MKIVSAASVGLEPGLRGLIAQRVTIVLFDQLVVGQRNKQFSEAICLY